MKEVALTRGMLALVDDEDYPRVANFTWHAIPRRGDGERYGWYARARINGKNVYLHSVISRD